MDGFDAYRYYMACKLHFTSDKYDVFESNGRVKGTRNIFDQRNDKYLFEKLARKYDQPYNVIQYFVANFAYGNDAVVYSDSVADENLVVWQKRKQSLTQTFKDDLDKIQLHLEKNKLSKDRLFNFVDGNQPELLKLFLGGHVCIETMVILNSYASYLSSWKDNANLLFEWYTRRIDKCKKFVKFDSDKCLNIFKHFEEEIAF